jgi:nitrate/nitrite transporter NarK
MRRIILMVTLVVAGELVFAVPFNLPRFFRPTVLEVFELTNTQLGDLFAVYGVVAMLAYFPGGALADHFSARSLLTASLFSTTLGGLYMATFPGIFELAILYGFWGLSTVFLFWGALIRATREWGGDNTQGLAFGILEGGRGLVAAVAALIAVNILAFYMPENARLATPEERQAGLRAVILFYTLLTFLAGLLVWFNFPPTSQRSDVANSPLKGMKIVLQKPIVWAQACIIICAYCGYKGLDNYSLYAVQVLGMDEVEGARMASYGVWARPFAALLAGVIADRYDATRSIAVTFVILIVSYGTWSMAAPAGPGLAVIYLNFVVTHIAVFALRGIYFTLLEEYQTPKYLTGASVGMISFLGFTPEAFFAPITGRILDANPGLVGFQHYFLFLALTALMGILVVVWLVWVHKSGRNQWKDVAVPVK